MPKIVFEAKKSIVSLGQAEELAGQLQETSAEGLGELLNEIGSERVFKPVEFLVVGQIPDVMLAPSDVEIELLIGSGFVSEAIKSWMQNGFPREPWSARFSIGPSPLLTDEALVRPLFHRQLKHKFEQAGKIGMEAVGIDGSFFSSVRVVDW